MIRIGDIKRKVESAKRLAAHRRTQDTYHYKISNIGVAKPNLDPFGPSKNTELTAPNIITKKKKNHTKRIKR